RDHPQGTRRHAGAVRQAQHRRCGPGSSLQGSARKNRAGMNGINYLDATAPEGMRLYAIGDVHGRFDCLTKMHAMIAAEIERDRPADWRIIHLGDYVDRGPQSREVLDFLSTATKREPRIIALRGNHDEGFLDFLADPADARLFIDYGGF